MNIFFSIETNRHTYGSSQTFSKVFHFRKYRIFWWFSNNTNIGFQTLLMNSPTFHMLTFFKILVFSGNQWIKGIHIQWRLQFIFVWIEQINFWECNVLNNVWHVNTTGCIMLMNGDECCFVSYIFNVVVFNWVTTAPGRFRRLVRGCDRLVSELCL